MAPRRTTPRHRHDPSKNFVGFLVGDVMYAVRIEVVREIVNPLPVVALPRAPRSIRGVADYRGLVVPVLDLRERFELDPVDTRRTKWIVIDPTRSAKSVEPSTRAAPATPASSPGGGGSHAALVVDSVTDVFGTGGANVMPAPPLGAGDDVRGIEGVTSYDGSLVFVLDVRAFAALAREALSQAPPAMHGASGATR